jgi:hypothetical protein
MSSIDDGNNDPGEVWCIASERRFLQKLIHHKTLGVNRQFNMMLLHMYMNEIYEDEEDVNFEVSANHI